MSADGSESKNKRGGYRPGAGGGNKFIPTAEQRNLVKLAISEGIAQERICAAIINPFTKKRISVETLQVAFAEEIEIAKFEVETMVGASLLSQIKKGNMTALIWWDKTRNRRSEDPEAAEERKLARELARAKVDPAGAQVKHEVEIVGGLPNGSTPDKPEGEGYRDIPPEESHG